MLRSCHKQKPLFSRELSFYVTGAGLQVLFLADDRRSRDSSPTKLTETQRRSRHDSFEDASGPGVVLWENWDGIRHFPKSPTGAVPFLTEAYLNKLEFVLGLANRINQSGRRNWFFDDVSYVQLSEPGAVVRRHGSGVDDKGAFKAR